MNWIEVNLTVSNSGRSRTVSKRAERIHFGSTSGTLRPPGQPGWCSPVALQRSNPALYQSKTTREKLKIPPDHTHTPDPVMNRLRMRPTSRGRPTSLAIERMNRCRRGTAAEAGVDELVTATGLTVAPTDDAA